MRQSLDEEKGEAAFDPNTPLVQSDRNRQHHQNSGAKLSSTIHWLVHLVCVSAALFVFLKPHEDDSVVKCWNKFNSYSPLSDFVSKHPYVSQPLNASKGYQSEFVGEATDASHQAWQDAMEYGLLTLSKDEIALTGYPDSVAKFPDSVVSGDRYPAVTIGRHQLHCLQFLWSDHHLDYYKSRRKFRELYPARYEGHFEHCVDYLRQRLMCHYDLTVVPYQWVRGEQAPFTGAISNEKCVDWPALKQWMRDAQPQTPEDFVWHAPDDAIFLDERP